MSSCSGDMIQALLKTQPMDADLSYRTLYGARLKAGFGGGREVDVVKRNANGNSLVEDRHTKRLFIMDQRGGLVQYFPQCDAQYFEQ